VTASTGPSVAFAFERWTEEWSLIVVQRAAAVCFAFRPTRHGYYALLVNQYNPSPPACGDPRQGEEGLYLKP